MYSHKATITFGVIRTGSSVGAGTCSRFTAITCVSVHRRKPKSDLLPQLMMEVYPLIPVAHTLGPHQPRNNVQSALS